MSVLYCFIRNRDIVDLIYRLIHGHNTKLLIMEYEQDRWDGDIDEDDDVGFYRKMPYNIINGDDFFMFNYRYSDNRYDVDGNIYHCDRTDRSVAKLKSNYKYSSGKWCLTGYK